MCTFWGLFYLKIAFLVVGIRASLLSAYREKSIWKKFQIFYFNFLTNVDATWNFYFWQKLFQSTQYFHNRENSSLLAVAYYLNYYSISAIYEQKFPSLFQIFKPAKHITSKLMVHVKFSLKILLVNHNIRLNKISKRVILILFKLISYSVI